MKPNPTERPWTVYSDRLDFVLPNFVRVSWSSVRADGVWRSRFSRVRAAVADIEWIAVAQRVRPCALIQLRSQDFDVRTGRWAIHGLAWRALRESGPRIGAWWLDSAIPEGTASKLVVVGSEAVTSEFNEAWEFDDHETMGTLLGYPACCRQFFDQVCVAQHCIDTTWAMATSAPRMDGREHGRLVKGPIAPNIMLQSLGIRAVPHVPCSFDCHETVRLAEDMAGVALKAGYEEEYRWLQSILSWPVEWSALHGIAEIRTPVLKLCIPTDATAGEYLVRLIGKTQPAEAAIGIGFPYNFSERSPQPVLVTLSNGTNKS